MISGWGKAALAAAMLLATLAGSAGATEFQIAPPGTKFVSSSGSFQQIDSVDGKVVRTFNASHAVTAWYGLCAAPTADQSFDAKALDVLWPLAAGKTASVEVLQRERRWAWTFKVVGREALTTPMGKSDTWLIEFVSKGLNHDYEAKTSCWYDPALGFLVKRNVKMLRGQGNGSAWQMVRVERQDFTKRVEYEVPTPGTLFATTNGVTFTVTGTRNHATLVSAGGRNHVFVGGLQAFLPDQITEQREVEAARIWPLEPGKRTRIEGGRNLTVYVHDVVVEGQEVITVPIGTFFTYRIRWTERSIGARSPEIQSTIWYAPALHFPIKEVNRQDGVARSEWEVRAITFPKPVEAARN